MIKTFKSVITSLLLISTTAVFGQGLSEQDRAVVDKQRNILSNPGFEASKVNWTNSGGTFSIVVAGSSNLLIGKGSATFDASATSQYLESAASPIPNGLYAQSCLAKIKYKGGDGNLTFQVTDGTNVIASQALSATTDPLDAELYFTCPSSGNLKLKLLSTADAAVIALDEGYIGQNYRIGNVAQAQIVTKGYFASTSSCTWSVSSSSFASFGTTSACPAPTIEVTGPGFSVSTTDTDLPKITITNAKLGYYKVHFSANGSNGTQALLALGVSDGTTTISGPTWKASANGATVSYGMFVNAIFQKTVAGDLVLEMKGRTDDASSLSIANGTSPQVTSFQVEYFPPASETVFAPNVQKGMGYVEWNANWTSSINNTSGSWTTYNATGADSNRTNGGICTTSGTANDVSCKVAKLPAGKYLVQVNGGVFDAHDSTSCAFGIYDGTNRKGISGASASTSSVGTFTIGTGVGAIFDYSSEQSNIEFKIQSAVISGSTGCRLRPGDFSGSSTGKGITISVIPIEQNIPMPQIVGATYSTEWTTYSLTIGATTTPPTLGTTTVNKAQWRRVGDTMEIKYDLIQTSAGTAGSGDYLFPLPAGYTIDTAKHNIQADRRTSYCGNGNSNDGGAAVMLTAYAYNTTNIGLTQGANLLPVGSVNGILSNTNMAWSFVCRVPISGWRTAF